MDILNFFQAQKAALELDDLAKKQGGLLPKPATFTEAATDYLAWYKENRKAYQATEHCVRTHLLPTFGEKKLSDITAKQIRTWLEKLATNPARLRTSKLAKKQNFRKPAETQDQKRARRATANRVFSVLKAILNRAFRESRVADDSAWRRVKPFEKVDEARIRFLTDAEAVRLVNACTPDLRLLVKAALLTGARYGELTALLVNEVNTKNAQVYISQSKSGKPRYIPLNAEGVALFKQAIIGKKSNELVFVRNNGAKWGKNHYVRDLQQACDVVKITPPVLFHELRHTYTSHLAQAGVDLLTISKLLGHADTRITAKHYAHLADKTLAAAVTKLPSFQSVPQVEIVHSKQSAQCFD